MMRRRFPASAPALLNLARNARQAWLLRRAPVAPPMDLGRLPTSASVSRWDLFGAGIEEEWDAVQRVVGEVFAYRDSADGVCPGERRALYYLARRRRARSVLEVGTHVGASTLYLAMALKAAPPSGRPPRLVTVDREDVNSAGNALPPGVSGTPRANLASLDCDEFVEFVVARSVDYLRGLPAAFDVVFLDGDHAASNVYREIPMALNVLRPGGCLVLHDFFPALEPVWPDGTVIPGPYLAVQRLRREQPGLTAIPLSPLPWITKMGSRASCLAVLARTER